VLNFSAQGIDLFWKQKLDLCFEVQGIWIVMEITQEKLQTSFGFVDGVDSKSCYMQKFKLYETRSVNIFLFYVLSLKFAFNLKYVMSMIWNMWFLFFDFVFYYVSMMFVCVRFSCCTVFVCVLFLVKFMFICHENLWIGQMNQKGLWRLFFGFV
jgi:hypothetical protein